jgi:hypothetical protein
MVANAVIWAGVILALSWLLQGTSYMSSMILVVGGGAATSILLLGVVLRQQMKNEGT